MKNRIFMSQFDRVASAVIEAMLVEVERYEYMLKKPWFKDPKCSVTVSGLLMEFKYHELVEYFSQFGQVLKILRSADKVSAVVEFTSEASVDNIYNHCLEAPRDILGFTYLIRRHLISQYHLILTWTELCVWPEKQCHKSGPWQMTNELTWKLTKDECGERLRKIFLTFDGFSGLTVLPKCVRVCFNSQSAIDSAMSRLRPLRVNGIDWFMRRDKPLVCFNHLEWTQPTVYLSIERLTKTDPSQEALVERFSKFGAIDYIIHRKRIHRPIKRSLLLILDDEANIDNNYSLIKYKDYDSVDKALSFGSRAIFGEYGYYMQRCFTPDIALGVTSLVEGHQKHILEYDERRIRKFLDVRHQYNSDAQLYGYQSSIEEFEIGLDGQEKKCQHNHQKQHTQVERDENESNQVATSSNPGALQEPISLASDIHSRAFTTNKHTQNYVEEPDRDKHHLPISHPNPERPVSILQEPLSVVSARGGSRSPSPVSCVSEMEIMDSVSDAEPLESESDPVPSHSPQQQQHCQPNMDSVDSKQPQTVVKQKNGEDEQQEPSEVIFVKARLPNRQQNLPVGSSNPHFVGPPHALTVPRPPQQLPLLVQQPLLFRPVAPWFATQRQHRNAFLPMFPIRTTHTTVPAKSGLLQTPGVIPSLMSPGNIIQHPPVPALVKRLRLTIAGDLVPHDNPTAIANSENDVHTIPRRALLPTTPPVCPIANEVLPAIRVDNTTPSSSAIPDDIDPKSCLPNQEDINNNIDQLPLNVRNITDLTTSNKTLQKAPTKHGLREEQPAFNKNGSRGNNDDCNDKRENTSLIRDRTSPRKRNVLKTQIKQEPDSRLNRQKNVQTASQDGNVPRRDRYNSPYRRRRRSSSSSDDDDYYAHKCRNRGSRDYSFKSHDLIKPPPVPSKINGREMFVASTKMETRRQRKQERSPSYSRHNFRRSRSPRYPRTDCQKHSKYEATSSSKHLSDANNNNMISRHIALVSHGTGRNYHHRTSSTSLSPSPKRRRNLKSHRDGQYNGERKRPISSSSPRVRKTDQGSRSTYRTSPEQRHRNSGSKYGRMLDHGKPPGFTCGTTKGDIRRRSSPELSPSPSRVKLSTAHRYNNSQNQSSMHSSNRSRGNRRFTGGLQQTSGSSSSFSSESDSSDGGTAAPAPQTHCNNAKHSIRKRSRSYSHSPIRHCNKDGSNGSRPPDSYPQVAQRRRSESTSDENTPLSTRRVKDELKGRQPETFHTSPSLSPSPSCRHFKQSKTSSLETLQTSFTAAPPRAAPDSNSAQGRGKDSASGHISPVDDALPMVLGQYKLAGRGSDSCATKLAEMMTVIMRKKGATTMDCLSCQDIAHLLLATNLDPGVVHRLSKENLLESDILSAVNNDDLKELEISVGDRKRIEMVVTLLNI